MDLQDKKKKIIEKVEKSKSEIISLAQKLVQIPSENPPGDMKDIATFISDFLNDKGIQHSFFEPENGKINIVAKIGNNKDKNLVLNGHMDVVPANDYSRWKIHPYSGIIKDGYLYGRGASDMKGGLTGIIFAFTFLSEIEDYLNGTLTLTLVPDEETGGLLGTNYLLENKKINPTAAIVAEPSTLELLDIGQKGNIWLKFLVKGLSTHAALSSFAGDNAIIKACDILNELKKIPYEVEIHIPREINEIIQLSREIAARDIGVAEARKIIDSITFNVGTIHGGTKSNIVPDRCIVEIDMRLPVGVTKKEIEKRISTIFSRYGNSVETLGINGGDPNYTNPSEEIVQIAVRNIKKYVGLFLGMYIDWTSSDAKHFRRRNIPTIQYGPCYCKGIHGYNERIKVEDILTATKVYIGTAFDYLVND
ncbi:MAG: ArgE/DapE family deacylase [Candidatus Asgardarchaeia archaeon]